jgi:hypothetical protein
MGAAILLNFVSGGLKSPILGLADRPAILFDDGLVGIHKPSDLLRRNILARKKSMLVTWHSGLSQLQQNPAQSPRQASERH